MTAPVAARAATTAVPRIGAAAEGAPARSAVQSARQTVTGATPSAGQKRSRTADDSRIVPKRKTRAAGQRDRGASTRRGRPTSARALQPRVGILIAEWLVGLVLIVLTVPMEHQEKGYQSAITTTMLRLTGLSGTFFVLALFGASSKTSRFAIWFGLIVDLGIVYHATVRGSTKSLSNVFGGKSSLPEHVQLASDWKGDAKPPQPTGMATPGAMSATPPPASGGMA